MIFCSVIHFFPQTLLNPDVLANNAGMLPIVCNFLEPGVYNRGKGMLARRVSVIIQMILLKTTQKEVCIGPHGEGGGFGFSQ